MSDATDKLCRLLDERGVEWFKDGDGRTMWLCGLPMCYATEWGDDTVWLDAIMTTEQAVEATLGRGTCKDCAHAHITIRGDANKWCDVIATHNPDGDGDPPNGYDPEPYFCTDFYCGFFKQKEMQL